MEMEIVKRYYYQRGTLEHTLRDDIDLDKAAEILHNQDEYNRILGKSSEQ
jgi:carboxyl-terminal processing protease